MAQDKKINNTKQIIGYLTALFLMLATSYDVTGASVAIRRDEMAKYDSAITVNVTNYGAIPYVPQNLTVSSVMTTGDLPDYTVEIQAALDDAYASGGMTNTVFFPHGFYRITDPLIVPPGINIKGVGQYHIGDFGNGLTILDTNAFSVIWQSDLTRACIAFTSSDKRGSRVAEIEFNGYVNPLEILPDMGTASSANLALMGVFIGSSLNTDWETTATTGTGYSGDVKWDNVSVVGFKVGIRSTANSAIFNRLSMSACDIGYQNTTLCCGLDQTSFNQCSANNRNNGIGYDFWNGGGGRGTTFYNPNDYHIGTHTTGTNMIINLIGGNLEFTQSSSTRTNFINAWGSAPIINIIGTRLQIPWCTSVINYNEWQYGGPYGAMIGVSINDDMANYSNAAKNAGLAAGGKLLVRAYINYAGYYTVNGLAGWLEITDADAARTVINTYPMNGGAFAPAIAQPSYYWGTLAYGNIDDSVVTYGRPWILRGDASTPDWMEVWLANTTTGPMAHSRFLLSDPITSTSAAASKDYTVEDLNATGWLTINGTGVIKSNSMTVFANLGSGYGGINLYGSDPTFANSAIVGSVNSTIINAPGSFAISFRQANSETWQINTDGDLSSSGAFGIITKFTTHTAGSVLLTGDNTTLSIGDYSQFHVLSDDTTAANRTFILPDGIEGRQLVLVWGNANAGEILDNAPNATGPGIVLLNGDWRPTAAYHTLTLVGVGNNWVETARSAP